MSENYHLKGVINDKNIGSPRFLNAQSKNIKLMEEENEKDYR